MSPFAETRRTAFIGDLLSTLSMRGLYFWLPGTVKKRREKIVQRMCKPMRKMAQSRPNVIKLSRSGSKGPNLWAGLSVMYTRKTKP